MAVNIAATPLIGANLDAGGVENVVSPVQPRIKLGTQVLGADGKLYVYAKASGAIAPGVAVCTVNPATFAASNTGGAYTSPSVALVTNDCAWFSKASV